MKIAWDYPACFRVLLLSLPILFCNEGRADNADPAIAVVEKTTSTASRDDDHLVPAFIWGPDGETKLQVGGEIRARAEYRDNFDLDDSDDFGDDGLGFWRTRVNFDLTYRSVVRAFVEIMDAREIDALYEQNQESHADLHQAFLEFQEPGGGPWGVRFGRQELKLGRDRRLSDASNWSNLRRRFDGIRAMYRTDKLDADFFVLQPNYYKRRRGNDTVTDNARRRKEEYFYGGYITSRHYAPHTIEAYFLGLSDRKRHRTFNPDRTSEDGTYGSSHRYTIGTVLYGPLHENERGELTYTLEGAWQFGRSSKDQIRAYFLRGDVTYEWKRPWKPTLGLVGTLASGDRDSNDGVAGRFDYLFGTSHSPYGIMDYVRPRNLRELALVGTIEPTEKLTFEAEAHAFWLDSKTDTWPNGPDQDSLRDTTGNSGREIGQEISLVAEYEWNDNLTLEAGAAHFFPGSYPGAFGRDDGANLFYLQTRLRF